MKDSNGKAWTREIIGLWDQKALPEQLILQLCLKVEWGKQKNARQREKHVQRPCSQRNHGTLKVENESQCGWYSETETGSDFRCGERISGEKSGGERFR